MAVSGSPRAGPKPRLPTFPGLEAPWGVRDGALRCCVTSSVAGLGQWGGGGGSQGRGSPGHCLRLDGLPASATCDRGQI